MISALARTQSILTRIRIALGNPDDVKMPKDNILFVVNQKQIEIAETHMVVESSMSLSVVANTAAYDLTLSGGNPTGFWRKKLIAPPDISRAIIFELDTNEFDFYKRYTRVSTGLPIWYVKIWQGTLTFFPTPSASETWTIFFYKSPTTTPSVAAGSPVAPETPSTFDSALVYGALMELDPERFAKWMPLYQNAVNQALSAYRSTRTEMMQKTYRDF